MIRRRHNRQRTRGQALVEFALVLPIFILVLFGILDFGRAIYAYNTISNASRQAVRVGIVDQNDIAVENEAIQHGVALGLTATDVDVTFLQPGGSSSICVAPVAIACDVAVTVRYRYQAVTPIIGALVGVIDMSSTSREPVERSYASP
jgi:Flp pilus assembly protein TadG